MIASIDSSDRQSVEKFSNYSNTLIDRLLKSIEGETSLNVIDTHYEVIYNLINKLVLNNQLSFFMKKFMVHFKNIIKSNLPRELLSFGCNMDFLVLSMILGKVVNDNPNILSDVSDDEFFESFDLTIALF